jgi:hypothetical protein
MAKKFLSDIELDAGLVDVNGNTGASGQILSSTGTGVSWVSNVSISEASESVHITVKNTSGATIAKGTPVYVTGETGNSGKIEVAPADASDDAKMPALGILESNLANNAEGFCVQGGLLEGLSTATIDGTSTTANDTVYIKAGGGLTMTKPTGTNFIQNIAKVARVHASNGSLVVSSILRTNDVPTPLYIDHANQRVGIGEETPLADLHISKDSTGPELRLSHEPASGFGGGGLIRFQGGSSDYVYGGIDWYNGANRDGQIVYAAAGRAMNFRANERGISASGGFFRFYSGITEVAEININGIYGNAFYDQGNTAYYVNPADSSTINTLYVTTINRNPVVTLSGDVTGSATMTNLGSINIATTVADDSHTHDGRYYTETESDSRFVNVTGDTMTGALIVDNDITISSSGTSGFGKIHYGINGTMGQTTNWNPNSGNEGLWIESDGGESGGVFMNGNTFALWSPGDDDAFKIYDEDGLPTAAPVFRITGAGVVVGTKGFSTDGNNKFYTWRAIENTGASSNQYYRIARISGGQSTRFIIEIAGRSASYGDNQLPAFGKIVGQLNNDNNYDIVYYNASGQGEVATEVGQVDIGTTGSDIYVRIAQFAELTATAHISDGAITTYDTDSGSSTTPTGYVQAIEHKLWSSGNDGAGSGLDADLLDGNQGSYYLDYNNFTNLPTLPSANQLVKNYQNVNYVASDPTASGSRTNYGVGVTVYEGYAAGTNRPHTYDATVQFMPTGGQGFELSANWIGTTSTPLKIRSLRDTGQGWSPWVDVAVSGTTSSGTFSTTGDYRAPIFYDSNDTNYYGNFASNSRYNTAQGNYLGLGVASNTSGSYRLNMGGSIDMNSNDVNYVNQLHFQDNLRFYDEGNDSYLNFKYGDSNFGGIIFKNGGGTQKGLLYAENGGFGLLDSDGNWAVRTQTGASPLELSCDNNTEFQVYNSYTLSPGSSRAPIFYDSNDTGYFFNGNASKDGVDLITGGNYAINVLGTISGGHRKHGNLETPEMQWSVGGSTDLNWKKLCDVIVSDANYSGWGAEIEITDFSGNYGNAAYNNGELFKGALSIYHWGGSGDNTETAYANIPYEMRNNVRWYKVNETGQNRYQLQVKSPANFRQLYIKVKPGIGNQVADIISYANDTNGLTSGGTAYASTQYNNFNHEFAGGIWTNDNRSIGWKNAFGTPSFINYYGAITTNTTLYIGGSSSTQDLYCDQVRSNSVLDKSNSAYYFDGGSTGDSIRVAGDVVAYYSSDERLKDNIKPIENALEKVNAIRGVTFEWNEKSHKTTGKKDVGVVAQEIEAVLPELVETRTNGYKAVDYQKLTAVLIESVKELTAKVEALESKQCNCK